MSAPLSTMKLMRKYFFIFYSIALRLSLSMLFCWRNLFSHVVRNEYMLRSIVKVKVAEVMFESLDTVSSLGMT